MKEMLKENSKTSLMRFIALIGSITGCLVALSGVVMHFLGLDGMAICGIGAGMVASAQAFKSRQKKHENNDTE